jgi:hypothetical protein
LPSASWDRVSGYVVSLAENPPLAPRAVSVLAVAQKPVAELPRVYIDTTWNPPLGGTTWAAHTSAQLSSALTASYPGDVIVLDAGVTYVGNFYLPSKANPNNKWIYVISSALATLPAGVRVSPAVAANMPKIVAPAASSPVYLKSGANHWRFSGIEVYSASTYVPTGYPTGRYYGQALVQNYDSIPAVLPDSITFDRCYIHGDTTHDVQRALAMNWSNAAVIDSYISEIHAVGMDTQAIGLWITPGPIKITNNFLEAATENVILGGAGGANQPYITSDVEVRNNYFFKPLSWAAVGVGISPGNTMVVKNHFEIKNGQRVLIDSNTFENNWANGQTGFSVLFTIMTSQSGNIAVVQDITATNNILKNVVSGFETMTVDWLCHLPSCTNPGYAQRINITNNLITFYDPTLPGGARNAGLELNPGQDWISNSPNAINGVPKDVVFQHNTMIAAASQPCWNSVIFATNTGQTANGHASNNVWILDNVLCREVAGVQGQAALAMFMGDPTTSPYDITQRFYGNVMYAPKGDTVNVYPAHNYATTVPVTYVNPATGNFQLLTPYWTDTSDGQLAGINNANLP